MMDIVIDALMLILNIPFYIFLNIFSFSEYNTGYAIISLSVLINLILEPLYKYLDVYTQHKDQKTIDAHVDNLKKYYSKIKLFYYTQEIYNIYKYSYLYKIASFFKLSLMAIVFIFIFYFLKNLEINQATFFLIGNLEENNQLLPWVMLIINIINSLIFTKNKTIRIQQIGISFIFFIVLYQQPSLLLMYWITNGIYSLVKLIILRFLIKKS